MYGKRRQSSPYTLEAYFRERGMIAGQAKGRAEGLALGEIAGRKAQTRRILFAQLNRRFGDLPDHVCQRIQQANIDDLECWVSNVIDALNLEDVFSARSWPG